MGSHGILGIREKKRQKGKALHNPNKHYTKNPGSYKTIRLLLVQFAHAQSHSFIATCGGSKCDH